MSTATQSEAPRGHRPDGLSTDTYYLGRKLDEMSAEIRALREKAPSPKLLIGAILFFFTMQSATTIFLISGLLYTRGVDLGAAATATREVVSAGTTTTTTTETVTPPAAEE